MGTPLINDFDTEGLQNSFVTTPGCHIILDSIDISMCPGTPVINDIATPIINDNSVCMGTPLINDFDSEGLQNSFVTTPGGHIILDSIDSSMCQGTPVINDIATPNVTSQSSNTLVLTKPVELLINTLELDNEAMGVEATDDLTKLKNIRLSNVNRLIIAQLNINSLRNKFEALVDIISGKIDILILTETKLDKTFPMSQFFIDGFAPPFRLDRNSNGGGVMIYIREDIPCKRLKKHGTPENFEGIFLEINLRKRKLLLFGGYNPNKANISNFLNKLGPILDEYMPFYDDFLLLGDFNAEVSEPLMEDFCAIYCLKNLIKVPTCFKNPLNPSSIDVILTNRYRIFQNSVSIETGLSDHHKMTITVLKSFFQKQSPRSIRYRDYKNFNLEIFRSQLIDFLNMANKQVVSYEIFERNFVRLLDKHAPLKEKHVRANNASFMNKTLSKAFMTRSRLRNKFLRNPSSINESNYKKYRNYCTNLVRKEKKNFYSNLDINLITDNKKFWKTIKPLFSEKHVSSKQITLLVDDRIISSDTEVAETFNLFFSKAVENLGITGFEVEDFVYNHEISPVKNITHKFRNHPSILKIKEMVTIGDLFHFSESKQDDISSKLTNLNTKKATTFRNIPSKILVETSDIISPIVTKIINDAKSHYVFPLPLKLADITPTHKQDETTFTNNYRSVSILPSVSKIFERDMEEQISTYMEKFLSPFLCGFRKGFSTQHCLMVMLELLKKGIDQGRAVGALLTDLSKAFDCINHELLIAKMAAYGFDHDSLSYIYSYLTDRKQRTKINNSFSSWCHIKSGVPQGSILGPLLFNVYLNDLFYFTKEMGIANYADDNTEYAIEKDIVTLLDILEKNVKFLTTWFTNNYFKMNADKCKLFVSKHDEDASILINNEVVEGNKSVKLLGIKIDNELKFKEHVTGICNKVSQKLHALARISGFVATDKLRVILKAFIESQFQYCPLVWMFHSRILNNRINRLHERALRLVYKEPNLSFEELLIKDKSFCVHHRNLQALAIEMYKFHKNISPEIMNLVFKKSTTTYHLRNKNPFTGRNARTVYYGTETISFRGPKIWALIPEDIRAAQSLEEFKAKIKTWKPEGCTCRLCKVYIQRIGFL